MLFNTTQGVQVSGKRICAVDEGSIAAMQQSRLVIVGGDSILLILCTMLLTRLETLPAIVHMHRLLCRCVTCMSRQEEHIRQSCLENLVTILAFLAKCEASGDKLDTKVDASTLVAYCESEIRQGTYEKCWGIRYASTMALKQTDLETWYTHWDSEEDGCSSFLEYGRTLTPSEAIDRAWSSADWTAAYVCGWR
jgi:hypothetical protein